MVTDERMEVALRFLANTDEEAAELKVDVERQAWVREQAEHRVFQLTEGTIPERKATAALSGDVSEATEKWLQAMLKSKKMEARRATAALNVEVWRTSSANRRQGHVT